MDLNYANFRKQIAFIATILLPCLLLPRGSLTCAMEPVVWRPRNEVWTERESVALPGLTSPFRMSISNHEAS